MSGAVPLLREWLEEAPFGLAMSSGFFAFYAHCGVLAALEEQGLLPSHISGSSAGALVGGAWAAGVDATSLRRTLLSLQRQDFWDPAPGPGLLRGRRFVQQLETLLPTERFEQCRTSLAVSAFDLRRRRTAVLRKGKLARSIAASCAVPLLFHPVWIDGRPHVDGGVKDRHGMAGMDAQRVFYHHIASRSPWRNPHSPALKIPHRPGLKALSISGLPRVGPFRLENGERAFTQAYQSMREALELPATAVIRL